MNIFITSDTHGDLSRVLEMYDAVTGDEKLEGIPHVDKFDCLIHSGDYKKDAFELGKKLGLEVYSAFGNCDDYWSPDFDVLDTPAGSIVITHGHIEDINNTHEHLYELADDQGCNCICYGHSHIPCYGEENGYLVINPGSPTKPLDGTMGSCAVLTADENGYHGEIVYYAAVKAALKGAEEEASVSEPQPQMDAEPEPEPQPDAEAEPEPKPQPDAEPEPEPQPETEAEPEPQDNAPAEDETKEKPKKKFGGFLRKIFNYSDGQ